MRTREHVVHLEDCVNRTSAGDMTVRVAQGEMEQRPVAWCRVTTLQLRTNWVNFSRAACLYFHRIHFLFILRTFKKIKLLKIYDEVWNNVNKIKTLHPLYLFYKISTPFWLSCFLKNNEIKICNKIIIFSMESFCSRFVLYSCCICG